MAAKKMKALEDLFEHELKDLYDAEHRISEALPKMKSKAKAQQLKDAFDEHLKQTKEHISRMEEVMKLCNIKVERQPCKGIQGLIKEAEELMEEAGTGVIDATLIIAAQKVEHYEIASYGSARTHARLLGQEEAKNLLQQTLDEEGETDHKLTRIAQELNPAAVS